LACITNGYSPNPEDYYTGYVPGFGLAIVIWNGGHIFLFFIYSGRQEEPESGFGAYGDQLMTE